MWNFLSNLISTKEKSVDLDKPRSMVLESEEFDPKTAVVPGPMKERLLEYYIFCQDPKASDDKDFLYYKKVFTSERTKDDAERTLHQLKSKYNHMIVTYDPAREEVIGVPQNSVELVKTKIKEYRDTVFSGGNSEALLEFAVAYRKE